MKTVFGYDIILRKTEDDGEGGITEKFFAGTISNSFGISPEVKESLTKADKGFKKPKVVGYQYEFGIEGLVSVKDDGETTDDLSKEDIIDMTTDGEEFDFVYGGTESGEKTRTGKLIITNYSESSNSEDEATYSVSCRGTVPLAKSTVE